MDHCQIVHPLLSYSSLAFEALAPLLQLAVPHHEGWPWEAFLELGWKYEGEESPWQGCMCVPWFKTHEHLGWWFSAYNLMDFSLWMWDWFVSINWLNKVGWTKASRHADVSSCFLQQGCWISQKMVHWILNATCQASKTSFWLVLCYKVPWCDLATQDTKSVPALPDELHQSAGPQKFVS